MSPLWEGSLTEGRKRRWRLGQILSAERDAGGLASKGGDKSKVAGTATYTSIGVTKGLSVRAAKLAEPDDVTFERDGRCLALGLRRRVMLNWLETPRPSGLHPLASVVMNWWEFRAAGAVSN